MGFQESGDVLTRGRTVESNTVSQQESAVQNQSSALGSGNLTACNAAFDRRRNELKKQMAKDHAAAEAELARLSGRCDILKEFLLEADTAAEELENLNAIIHAEKEFANRMEQLEIRYYRAYGKYSDDLHQELFHNAGTQSSSTFVSPTRPLVNALPLIGAIIFSSLIIAAAMAMIFL